jgi:dolichol-phosphate mannosyltransferase
MLSVVIPVYREAANVVPMVERLHAALAGIAWEAVFVDDDSPDGTTAAVRAVAARDPHIRCIRRVGRRGLASASIEGMLSVSSPYVAVMDGDLQHDETILPAMLRAAQEGADIAIGSRHVAGGAASGGFSAARGALSDAGTRLAQALLPVPVADPMSGYFLLRRDLVEKAAPRLTGRGFKILLDLLLTVPKTVKVVEVPYSFRAREHGDSKLDVTVLMEFAGLLLDKLSGGLVPLRFVAFAAVGGVGGWVDMRGLRLLMLAGAAFGPAQWAATLVAMTANFVLNNGITYRDARLRGTALWRGLAVFYLVCGIGAAANVGIANLLMRDGALAWGLAGAAGALITVVWNYAVSSTLVWRTR